VLIDITNLYNKQTNKQTNYVNISTKKKTETSKLHNAVVLTDVKYTPLNLQTNEVSQDTNKIMSDADKIQQWCQKVLHGRYLYELNQEYIDKNGSHAWLTQSDIFPATEGFMCAIMDQVIVTNNYRKYILKDNTADTDLSLSKGI
jgi:hypothetical protein